MRRSSSPSPGIGVDELRVQALEPVAARLLAQRRLEPRVVLVHLGVVVLVVEHPHQAGMGDRDVVALEVVLGHDLPVRRLRAAGRRERLERRDPVALEPLRQVADELGQRRRVGVEVDEHEPAQLLDPRRHQARAPLVEPLAELQRPRARRSACRRAGRSSRGSGSGSRALHWPEPLSRREPRWRQTLRYARSSLVLVADDEHRLRAGLRGHVAARARQRARRGRPAARCARRCAPARPRAAPGRGTAGARARCRRSAVAAGGVARGRRAAVAMSRPHPDFVISCC